MDTPTNTPTTDPNYTPPPIIPSHPKTDSRLRAPLTILVVVILVGLVGYAAYHFWNGRGDTGPVPANAHIVLSSERIPPYAARTIDFDGKSLAPIVVEGQGTATTYDEALTETYAYYLISGPAAGQSTLYRQDRANPAAGLSQLTQSASFKVDLSLDEASGVFAYTVRNAAGGTNVAVWDSRTDTEKDLGQGSRPTVLANGSFVLFERDGALVTVEIESGKASTLVLMKLGTPFAVDASAARLAVYNAETDSVDQYLIDARMTEVILDVSEPAGGAPNALFYSEGRLLLARMLSDTLTLTVLGGERIADIPAPGLSLEGLSLSLQYDHDQ